MLPGAWQAQLVQRATGDLGVVSSSPLLGVKIIKKKKKKNQCSHEKHILCLHLHEMSRKGKSRRQMSEQCLPGAGN